MSGPVVTDIAPGQLSADRGQFWNASDVPAALGISPYTTRQELLNRLKYGVCKPATSHTEKIWAEGHEIEALARPIAERLIGDLLPPKRVTLGKLGATLDGYTVNDSTCEPINWECKSLNDAIRAAFPNVQPLATAYISTTPISLPDYLCAQMEHQLICSGADMCLFTAANLDGESAHCWYHSDATMRQRIVDGWAQLERDLAAMPEIMPQAIVGELMPVVREFPTYPAVRIETTGISSAEWAQIERKIDAFILSINFQLVTDQDFATGKSDVSAFLIAAAGFDAALKTLPFARIRDKLNKARISLENQLTTRQQARKQELLKAAQWAYGAHISALDVAEYVPLVNVDFAGAIKGKSSFASMQNTLDSELLRALSGSNSVAARVRENLALIAQANVGHLFPDLRVLVLKDREDLKNLISARLANAKAAAELVCKVPAEAAIATIDDAPESGECSGLCVPDCPDLVTLSNAQINTRLGLTISREFLACEGFKGFADDRGVHVYLESDFPKIVAAIIAHLRGLV